MDQSKEPGNIPPNQSLQSDDETVQSADHTIRSAESLPYAKGLAVGDVVEGRYKVLSVIGRGAVGCVYRVEKVSLNQQYALKALLSAVNSDVARQRFQKEARAAGRLEHPNVVRAIDFGIMEGNQPFIVMDLVEGQTLAEYLKICGKMTVETALQIFIPICHGLAHAHNGGVIHRDIKPSNIVLVLSGTRESQFVPKIVDFGIAKLEAGNVRDEQALTKVGEIFGTPLYMSPEQCAGLEVDDRSDIYSLGCVIFEALTGAPPFKGESALATMMKHQNERPLSLKEASNGLDFPPGLEAVVAKMLAKERDNRYFSCFRLAEDLIILQQGERVPVSKLSASASKVASSRWLIPMSFVYFLLIPVIASIAILVYTSIWQSQQQKPVSAPLTGNSGTAKAKETEHDQVCARFCTGDRGRGRTFKFGNRKTDPAFTYGSSISCFNPNEGGAAHRQAEPAVGIIQVRPGYYVRFEPSLEFTVRHPNLFHCFRKGDIQGLSFFCTSDFGFETMYDSSAPFNAAMAYVDDLNDLDTLTFQNVPVDADGLAKIKLDSMHGLTSLHFINTSVDGNDLGRCSILGNLDELEFSEGKNASALLKALKGPWHNSARARGAKGRRQLFLRGDKLTDDDLSIIGDCDCWDLNISDNPDLTSKGLRQLFKQQKLSRLMMDGQRFDRSFLKELASRIHLDVLRPGAVIWTEDEQEQFRKSLPKCSVYFGETSHLEPVPKASSALPEAPKKSGESEKAQQHPAEDGEAKILTQQAEVCARQGKYAEAEPLFARALNITNKASGPNHPDIVPFIYAMADCYEHQGLYKEAEPLLKRALEICKKAHGKDIPDAAESLTKLAECYDGLGNYQEEEPLLKQALAIMEKKPAQDGNDHAQTLDALANCYEHLGKHTEAEQAQTRAHAIHSK